MFYFILLVCTLLLTGGVSQWSKYISCIRLPDVHNEKEMNSYLSVWRDNPNEEIEERDIQEDFRSAQEGIQVRFDLCDLKRINQ